MSRAGWAASYTWRTTASVILCMVTLANLATQLMPAAPNSATPLAAASTAMMAFIGWRVDPANRNTYLTILRIVVICCAFSLALSLILLGTSPSEYGSVIGE
jgi:hypothetical protein